jgi:hypothetical protein
LVPLEIFGWGCLGSVAAEVILILRSLDTKDVPLRYRRPTFYIWRVVLALIGGAVAVAFQPRNALVALTVGAAAPSILKGLVRGVKP